MSTKQSLGVVPLESVRTTGGLLFVSGTVGWNESGEVPESFSEQTVLALEHLRGLLDEAGSSMNDVVSTTVYIVDRTDFADMNRLYAEYFEAPWPTRTTIVCDLAVPGIRFEISAIAARS